MASAKALRARLEHELKPNLMVSADCEPRSASRIRRSSESSATFHGLRHTVGTLLIEAGYDLDTVRRWLGQKTLAMAIHYSETADTSQRMSQVITKFDPLGSKSRT